MDDRSPMECGGNDAALADHALGPAPEDAPSSERVEEAELPQGWQWIALSKVVIKAKQTNPLAEPEREFTYVDVSSISRDALSIKGTSRILGKDAPSRARKLIRAGDVIFATVRPSLRRVATVPPDLDGQVCSTAFCVIRANPETADPGFLFFATAFEDFVKRVSEHQRGSSYPAVTDGQILAERISLPPVPEQRAIAAVLRTVQGAKEACEQVLAATRQLKQSLLHHLFTYGPVAFADAAHVPLKETEIGEVPESWRPTTLGQVADIGYGVQAAVAHLKDPSKGIPILTNVNITRTGDIDLTTLRYYEVPQAKRDRFILKKGDVLFNWRSGSQEHVGKTALFMLDGEYTHSSFILRMRCSDAIRPQFLAKYLHWLRSRRYFARTRQQSSVNSVFNKSLSETIPVLLPPLGLQDEIAGQLSAVDAKLAAEESRRAALAALFQSLLHHLMTGKVRLPDFTQQPEYDGI